MTEDMVEQVRHAVREDLSDAAWPFRRDEGEDIEENVLAHTHLVVNERRQRRF
jgi:hypothetical protein